MYVSVFIYKIFEYNKECFRFKIFPMMVYRRITKIYLINFILLRVNKK